MTQQKYALLKY